MSAAYLAAHDHHDQAIAHALDIDPARWSDPLGELAI